MTRTLPIFLAAVFLLFGCSVPMMQGTSDPNQAAYVQALAGRTAVYSWTAKGRMHFTCTYDAEGLFWKFSHPSGTLYSEDGRTQGTLNSDWSISGRDGSRLHARILLTGPAVRSSDLRNAVFEATPPRNGMFSRISRIERKQARGGMPLTKCSASQRGQRLAVPFEARYVFWR